MNRWADQQGQYLFLVAVFAFLLVTGGLKSFRPRFNAVFLAGFVLLGLALFTDIEWLLAPALLMLVVPIFLDMRDERRRARETPPPRHAKYPPNHGSRIRRRDSPPGENLRRPPEA